MSNQEIEDQIDQKELAPGVLLIKEYKKVGLGLARGADLNLVHNW